MPSYLSLLADALMIAASAGAAVYCLVLSRRLSRLTGFDSGIGGAIAVLSVQVEEMKTALAAAKAGSDGAGAHLRELVGQAQQISSELELMIAACHDFAEQAPPEVGGAAVAPPDRRPARAAPAPSVVLPADVARTLQEAMAEVMALRHDLDARAAALAEREAAVALAQALVEARLAELAEAAGREPARSPDRRLRRGGRNRSRPAHPRLRNHGPRHGRRAFRPDAAQFRRRLPRADDAPGQRRADGGHDPGTGLCRVGRAGHAQQFAPRATGESGAVDTER
jgi:hypothetical protein